MNSQQFRENILSKKPRYANSRITVLDSFSEKGSRSTDYIRFGPYYEIYIYAMMLGIKRGDRLPLPPRNLTSDFVEIRKWKRGSALVDFLLIVLFTQTKDLNQDWNELEDMEEKDLNQFISNLILIMEEYANAGLKYLDDLLNKGEINNTHYLFIDIYKFPF